MNKQIYARQYYLRHKESFKQQGRKFRRKNPFYGREASAKYRKAHPLAKREDHLKARYNISLEEYDTLFKKQRGRCKICRRHQTELKRPLAVDHNHITGQIRGLLCVVCNTDLSILEDKIFCLCATLYLTGNLSAKI